MNSRKVIQLRQATERELAEFVIPSWVSSYRMSHFAGPIPMPLYREQMRQSVSWILARPDIEVLVAYKPDEQPPDDVYGWIVVESNVEIRVREYDRARGGMFDKAKPAPQKVVHYIFVKHLFRRSGVGRRLFAAAGVDPTQRFLCTHKTATSSRLLMDGKVPFMTFNPALARFPKGEPEKPNPEEFDE